MFRMKMTDEPDEDYDWVEWFKHGKKEIDQRIRDNWRISNDDIASEISVYRMKWCNMA